MQVTPEPFPATLDVDYPDRELDRLSTAFRMVAAVPVAIVLALISGPEQDPSHHALPFLAGGIIFVPTLVLLLFARRYPRWWFNWNLELTRFSTRVGVYLALLRDEYPSVDEEQAVHIAIPYPDAAAGLSRWLPLVKWLLAIPHYIVLAFVGTAALVCVVLAWFVILFTGRYPRSLFDFVVGTFRWSLRVIAYAFLLTTDRYPPFSLSP